MKLTVSNTNISNTLSTASINLGNASIVESLTLGNVSITPSQISVGNVSVTPTAVSVPTLVLGGTQFSGGLQGGIINYQQFTANGTWYNPYANASVNASLTGYEQVLVMAWGGGGGGSANASWGGGGGGGACFVGFAPLNAFANTCAVTVGLGGAGALSGTATSGGTTSFVINSSATVYAYGGSGTTILTNMGAGGGVMGAASGSTGGAPLGGTIGNPAGSSTFGGGGGGNATANYLGGSSIFGGAGAYTANTVYGGGVSGGTTVFGGAGGVYATTPAQAPGGGGTYFLNNTVSSSGARGEVLVWTFGPAGTTAGAPTYTLTANTTTLYESSSVLYTVSTTNVANGTALYYTLNNSSTAVATDFTTAVNGSVIINGGTGTFTLTANNDTDTANEAFQIDVRTDSTTGSIVASNGSVSVLPAQIISSNLIFWVDASNISSYPGTGNTWTDLSGSGYNGTLTNGPTYSSANGGIIQFDGVNDHVNFGTAMAANNAKTMGVWVRLNALNDNMEILSKSASGSGVELLTFNSGISYYVMGSGSNYNFVVLPYTNNFVTNQWYYIVGTHNGPSSTIRLYRNGVLANSASGPSAIANPTNLYIGEWNNGGRPLNGAVGEAHIYNRELSNSEILANFNSTKARYGYT